MYISTRDNYGTVSASTAIKLGMVPAGGLFVTEKISVLSPTELMSLQGKSYQELAAKILSLYLDDFTKEEIESSVQRAYNGRQFGHNEIAPLQKLDENTYILELWHGPTAAFKDMALQIMPSLLALSVKKAEAKKEVVILVATSGDTGKAALEGFKNVPGIKIIVFYPYQGVSKIQELQMSTTDGNNTYVVAVKGNFDDCQYAVKEIFGDRSYNTELENKGYELSSANSINWGRLLPQIVYYFHAYLNLLKHGEIKDGEKINFVIPTGNFGNILAGWYAYKMGLPIHKLVCASNENKVLTDFFNTGVYDKNRMFMQTSSPSMDILVSSNLERFLYEMVGRDGTRISGWMNDLNTKGVFRIDNKTKQDINLVLAADFADEEETLATIKAVFTRTGYTLDTHTAVGAAVYQKYRDSTDDLTKTVIVATASPFKFNSSVLRALRGEEAVRGKDECLILEELSALTKLPIHRGLRDLDKRPILHTRLCEKSGIKKAIEDILQI